MEKLKEILERISECDKVIWKVMWKLKKENEERDRRHLETMLRIMKGE
mgnify:CR=1 FL=1